ncbi:MAG: hypothetical protein NVS3B20_17460 [Polyangiales bacterium]
MRLTHVVSFTFAALACADRAQAASPDPFANADKSAPFADTGKSVIQGSGYLFRATNDYVLGGTEGTTGVSLSPTFDFFVMKGLSVGTGLDFGYSKTTSRTHDWSSGVTNEVRTTYLSLRPTLRIGYYLPLSERIGFWPIVRAGFSRAWEKSETDDVVSPSVSDSSWPEKSFIGFSAQIIARLDDHWFLNIAPFVASASKFDNSGLLGARLNGNIMLGIGAAL